MRAIAAVQVAVNLISMGRLGIYSVLYGMKTFIDTGVVEFGVLSFAVQCLLLYTIMPSLCYIDKSWWLRTVFQPEIDLLV